MRLGALLTEAAGGITINVGGQTGAKKPAAKDDKKKPKKKSAAKKGGGERDMNRRLMDLLAHHDAHAGYHRTKAAEHYQHAEYHRLSKKDGHLGVINRQISDGHRGLVKLYHKLGDTLEAVLRRRPEDRGKKWDKASARKEEMRKERASKKDKKKGSKKRKLKECLARFETVPLTENIKGWKNAHSDIMRHRAEQGKTVHLVKLKNDGSESKMHDARKPFRDEAEAHAYHKRVRELNPGRNIRHNLYVGGEHKGTLSESERRMHRDVPHMGARLQHYGYKEDQESGSESHENFSFSRKDKNDHHVVKIAPHNANWTHASGYSIAGRHGRVGGQGSGYESLEAHLRKVHGT